MPSVSIILVSFNSAEHLPACLAAIQSLQYEPAPQVVIVDNASRDGSAALARRLMPEALLLVQPRNLGFAGGVNLGVAASSGEIVALLNPDTAVDPGWLSALVSALNRPTCGIAGSKILNSLGDRLLHTGGILSHPLLLTSHRGDGEHDYGQYDALAEMQFVSGASFALRRSLWDALAGFDPGFFPAYFEELDLCLRAQARGLRVLYEPRSILRHVESTTTGKYGGAFYYYYLRNRLRFALKHLSWHELWNGFCPAEAARLSSEAPALDRLVAALVYREGISSLTPPDEAQQDAILATARTLASVGEAQQHEPAAWPAEVQRLLGIDPRLAEQLAAVRAEAVLHEHQFASRLPLVAGLRRAWNSIATRWYVLPVLHQQTRVNLALSRSLDMLARQSEAGGVPLGVWVYQAAMLYRLAQSNQ